jgi:hypothetical protein
LEDNYFDLAPHGSRTVRIVKSGAEREIVVSALNAKPVALTP